MGVIRQWELFGNGSYSAGELSTVEIIRNRSCPAMGVIRQWESSGNGSYLAMGVIRQWEISGNGSYPVM